MRGGQTVAAEQIPAWVLGGSGYVGAEVMRLLWGHPLLRLQGAFAHGQAGGSIEELFPHLHGVLPGGTFLPSSELDRILGGGPRVAVFSCLPHGATAATLDQLLSAAQGAGKDLLLVDLSADFRLPTADAYKAVYGHDHPAPGRIADFTCALPELRADTPEGPIAHPGCFTTCVTLGAAALHAQGLLAGPIRVSAVTGSTGSGRTPTAGTHHPDRHGSMKVYKPLTHRHRPEMEMLLGRLTDGEDPRVLFVPTSGPFARGIHATLHMELSHSMSSSELVSSMQAFYSGSPFVHVSADPPSLKEVVGTNRCRISAVVDGDQAVVVSTLDNLVKGAAGGAVQWMNRLAGLPESTGLLTPGLGWS
ncbi:MAG: N-acetyl-gamma-glutamyl-phosphate reductase [Gemmatimonadota bacterium]